MVEWTVARPKNTHICKPPFACQNVLKLTYSNLEFQNFLGRTPDTFFKGRGREGEGRGGEGGEREGRREGKDRKGGEGREGTGQGRREGGEEWGREGRGARHGLRPLETSSGSAPGPDSQVARPNYEQDQRRPQRSRNRSTGAQTRLRLWPRSSTTEMNVT